MASKQTKCVLVILRTLYSRPINLSLTFMFKLYQNGAQSQLAYCQMVSTC